MLNNPILVTGASGFVGSNLVFRLVNEGCDVHLILKKGSDIWRLHDVLDKVKVHYLDLTDRQNVRDLISIVRPKTIFHLAAYGAYSFQIDVDKIMNVNLFGTMNLLSACEGVGFDIFVNTGSSSEYGFKKQAMKEDDVLEPNSDYAVFKSSATLFCQKEARLKKMPVITLRPFSVYGFYEESARLVPTLIANLLQNKCPPLASPETARDYIFIEDMVDLYLAAADHPEFGGEIFNAGTGKQSTLKDVFEVASDLAGVKIEPKWNTMPPRIWDQNVWLADMDKTKSMLNWKSKYDLELGLKKTIIWFKNNISLYKK